MLLDRGCCSAPHKQYYYTRYACPLVTFACCFVIGCGVQECNGFGLCLAPSAFNLRMKL